MKIELCALIQRLITVIAILCGTILIINGEHAVGFGVLSAALSSSNVVTSQLNHCRSRREDDVQTTQKE